MSLRIPRRGLRQQVILRGVTTHLRASTTSHKTALLQSERECGAPHLGRWTLKTCSFQRVSSISKKICHTTETNCCILSRVCVLDTPHSRRDVKWGSLYAPRNWHFLYCFSSGSSRCVGVPQAKIIILIMFARMRSRITGLKFKHASFLNLVTWYENPIPTSGMALGPA